MSVTYAMHFPLTDKQIDALTVIANKDEGGKPLSLDEVIKRLSYSVTKQSFQFTLRSLIKRELVEKCDCEIVDRKRRRLLRITPLGLNRLHNELRRTEPAVNPLSVLVSEEQKTDELIEQIMQEYKGFY